MNFHFSRSIAPFLAALATCEAACKEAAAPPEIWNSEAAQQRGSADVELRIKWLNCFDQITCVLVADGAYHGANVGFEVVIGSESGKHRSIEFRSLGDESDQFIGALGQIYGSPVSARIMKPQAVADAELLAGDLQKIRKERVEVKATFAAGADSGFAVLYVNVDFPRHRLEIRESKARYRGAVIGALSQQVLGAAAPAAGAAAADAGALDSIEVGPLRTGMSFEQVRSATPQTVWQEKESFDAPHRRSLQARDAIRLGGEPYLARVTPGWYGEYRIALERRRTDLDPETCRQSIEALLVVLESSYGRFEAPGGSFVDEDRTEVFGRPSLTETHRVGTASTVRWHTTAVYTEANAQRSAGRIVMKTGGSFHEKGTLLFPKGLCRSVFEVTVQGKPPASEEAEAGSLQPILVPSIAVLSDTVEGLDLPPVGLEVSGRCSLSREHGAVGHCTLPAATPADLQRAVDRRREHMAFDSSRLDPGNPVPLFANLVFRFDASQHLAPGVPDHPLSPAAVAWTNDQDLFKWPTIAMPYPSGAHAKKPDEQSASVTATCQIQSDGSLLCPQLAVAGADGAELSEAQRSRFVSEARDRLRFRRAGTALKDGEPSAGHWVALELPLRLSGAPAGQH